MCEINETTSVGCNANNMEAERVNKLLEGAVHGKSEALALAKQTLDAAKSAGMELIRVSDYFYEFRNMRAEDAEAKCADYERLREAMEKIINLTTLQPNYAAKVVDIAREAIAGVSK